MIALDVLPERPVLPSSARSARFELRARTEGPPTARRLVLAIDRSSSMRGARFAHAKRLAAGMLALLPDGLEVALVAFDARVSIVLPPAKLSAVVRDEALRALRTLDVGHGTRVDAALHHAFALAENAGHVVLLTDGYPSYGATAIAPLVERTLQRGAATLTTVGIGHGSHDLLLACLARAGGGDAHFAEELVALATHEPVDEHDERHRHERDADRADEGALDEGAFEDGALEDGDPIAACRADDDLTHCLGRELALIEGTVASDVELVLHPAPHVRLDKLWYRGPARREHGARVVRLPRLVRGRTLSFALQVAWEEASAPTHLGLIELRARDADGREHRREAELRARVGVGSVDPEALAAILRARLHAAVHDAAVDGTASAPTWLATRVAELRGIAEQEHLDSPELREAFELASRALHARGPRALARHLDAVEARSLEPALRARFHTSIVELRHESSIVRIDD
jgi:hypothetical protein